MKALTKSTLRYKYDPEYRNRVRENVAKKHKENSQYPVYVDLCKLRSAICNFRLSIEHHQLKVKVFRSRIVRAMRKKEKLELEWGQLRAQIKRSKNE